MISSSKKYVRLLALAIVVSLTMQSANGMSWFSSSNQSKKTFAVVASCVAVAGVFGSIGAYMWKKYTQAADQERRQNYEKAVQCLNSAELAIEKLKREKFASQVRDLKNSQQTLKKDIQTQLADFNAAMRDQCILPIELNTKLHELRNEVALYAARVNTLQRCTQSGKSSSFTVEYFQNQVQMLEEAYRTIADNIMTVTLRKSLPLCEQMERDYTRDFTKAPGTDVTDLYNYIGLDTKKAKSYRIEDIKRAVARYNDFMQKSENKETIPFYQIRQTQAILCDALAKEQYDAFVSWVQIGRPQNYRLAIEIPTAEMMHELSQMQEQVEQNKQQIQEVKIFIEQLKLQPDIDEFRRNFHFALRMVDTYFEENIFGALLDDESSKNIMQQRLEQASQELEGIYDVLEKFETKNQSHLSKKQKEQLLNIKNEMQTKHTSIKERLKQIMSGHSIQATSFRQSDAPSQAPNRLDQTVQAATQVAASAASATASMGQRFADAFFSAIPDATVQAAFDAASAVAARVSPHRGSSKSKTPDSQNRQGE